MGNRRGTGGEPRRLSMTMHTLRRPHATKRRATALARRTSRLARPTWRPTLHASNRVRSAATRLAGQLVRFARVQARCCAFAVALFGGMAVSKLLASHLSFPVARYDLLLVYGVLLTAVGCALGWETRREVAVVAACHVLGLAFELVKVRVGSWSYPESGLTKIAGVPLYGGFMYAAVGSYVCRSWRLLDLTLTGYRARATALTAVGLYANFLSHHLAARPAPAAGRSAARRDDGDLGALHGRRAAPPHAAGARLRADRLLPLARREHRHLPRRLDLPVPAPRLGARPGVQVDLVGPADQRHVRHLRGATQRASPSAHAHGQAPEETPSHSDVRSTDAALPAGTRRDQHGPDDHAVPGRVLGRAGGEGQIAAGGVVAVGGPGEGPGNGPDDTRVTG